MDGNIMKWSTLATNANFMDENDNKKKNETFATLIKIEPKFNGCNLDFSLSFFSFFLLRAFIC